LKFIEKYPKSEFEVDFSKQKKKKKKKKKKNEILMMIKWK